jgi:hypothetical protein
MPARKTLAVLITLIAAEAGYAAAADVGPAPWDAVLPSNAVVAVQVAKPKEALDLLLSPRAVAAVTATSVYENAKSEGKFQELLGVVAYLQLRLGTEWQPGLHKLLDGGIAWAVTPDGGNLLIVDAQDEKLLGQLHGILLEFAKNDATKAGKPDRVTSTDHHGVTIWSLNSDHAHAIVGRRLLLANRAEVLKAALARKGGEGLATSANYRAAKEAAKGGTAFAYFDLETINKSPQVQKGLSEINNPLASLLTAGLVEGLRNSKWLALNLSIEGETLALRAVLDGKIDAGGPASFAAPKTPEEGALGNLDVPRRIAATSFYRDLHGFYAGKEKLFPERTSGLIFFENMMGIFFSGLELSDDIMAQPNPHVRFIVTEQQYDPAVGTPQVQLPAMAAVFNLRNPKKYGDIIESAWQKAIGLVSVTRGQKAELGLLIDRPTYNDVRYSVAYFPTETVEKGPVGTHFNFRPALVKLDEYLVISSTEQLARDLIDALKKEQKAGAKPRSGTHSLVEIDGRQLASVLKANQQNLVSDNMLKKGNSKQQAEQETEVFATIVRVLGQARLEVGSTPGGQAAALRVQLNLPSE